MQALLVPVGDDVYALAAERVREVSARPQITRLPTAPGWTIGLINLRGDVVPVLDTAALLGLGGDADPAFAVVVHTPHGLAALAATAMPEVTVLEEEIGPSELPGTLGLHRVGERLAVRIDIDALLRSVHEGSRAQAEDAS